jgi:hypothetical protein
MFRHEISDRSTSWMQVEELQDVVYSILWKKGWRQNCTQETSLR